MDNGHAMREALKGARTEHCGSTEEAQPVSARQREGLLHSVSKDELTGHPGVTSNTKAATPWLQGNPFSGQRL